MHDQVHGHTESELRLQLVSTVRTLAQRGFTPATGGNFSAVLTQAPLRLLMTPSGMDKGLTTEEMLLIIDEHGHTTSGSTGTPSAEAPLHVALAKKFGAGAVLHTHSIWNTLISTWHAEAGGVAIEGFEMLKTLAGVKTHQHREWIPIVENSQNMSDIVREFEVAFAEHPHSHGVLLRDHGLYSWGKDIKEAQRHVEGLEFLFEVVGRDREALHSK